MFLSSNLIDDFVHLTTNTDFVKVVSQPLIAVLEAGSKSEVTIEFGIKQGYYIMADHGSDKHLLYSSLRATGDQGIILGAPQFPAPTSEFVPGLSGTTATFRNTIKVRIPVSVEANATKGIHHIDGSMYFQPCDARQCYFPREQKFHVKLRIV